MITVLSYLFVEETCNDGVQNQGETDIDCGGVCGDITPCSMYMNNNVISVFHKNILLIEIIMRGAFLGCNAFLFAL